MSKQTLILISIVVMSAMHAGYRRGDHAFVKGENKIDVTKDQFKLIEQDPNLSLTVLDDNPAKDSATISQGSGPSGVNAEITAIVAAIKLLDKDDESLWTNSGKPATDSLPDGTSAKERDEAWDIVTKSLDNAE